MQFGSLNFVVAYVQPFQLDSVMNAIREAAHTGNPGDGKIFAGPVTLAQRIRTGEWGEAALRP